MSQQPEKPKERWKVDVIEYNYGQYVIREGEDGDFAYVIKQGEVEVVKKQFTGKEVHIARLGAQEIFGEMCLFEEKSIRSASVRVISDRALIMAISKTNFQTQLDAMPDGIRNIMAVLVKRLRKATHQISSMT
jgi:CRP-like cAMP-binding protein